MDKLFLSSLNKEHSRGEGYRRIYFSYASNKSNMDIVNMSSILMDEVKYDLYYCDYKVHTDISEDDLRESLKEMDLLIIFVDKDYFPISSINQLEQDIAKEINVPVLPILNDDEYISLFNEAFKHTQCLRAKEHSFPEKLDKFLRTTFNDTIKFDREKIKKIFSSPIFLSYRKKDIEDLRLLLENLHEEEELKPYQFWYDDFLNPGNVYDDEILEAMEASKIFILFITNNTFEEGNYVKEVEYPYAVSHNKNIIAVKIEEISEKQVKKEFPEVKKIFDCFDIKNIKEYILKHLEKIDIDSPETQFLLGQAYYHGVVVERNYPNAHTFFQYAADNGIAQTYKYLAVLDYEGFSGNSNIRSAVNHQQKHLENCCDKNRNKTEYLLENLLLCKYYLAFNHGLEANNSYYECFLDIDKNEDLSIYLEYQFIYVESEFLQHNYSTDILGVIKEIKNIIKTNYEANSDEYYIYILRVNTLFAQLAIGLENYEFAVNILKEYEKPSLNNVAYAQGSIEHSAKACYYLGFALEKLNEKQRALKAYENMFVFASFCHGMKLSHYFSIGLFKSTELDEKSSKEDIRKSWYYERQSAASLAESDRARFDSLYAYYLSMYDDNIFDLLKALYLYERYSCASPLTFIPEKISLYERILNFFIQNPTFSFEKYHEVSSFDYRVVQYITQKKDIALLCLSREIYLRTYTDEDESIIEEKTGQLLNVVLTLGFSDYDFQNLTDDYINENIAFFEDDEDEEEDYYLHEDYLGLEDTYLMNEDEEEY